MLNEPQAAMPKGDDGMHRASPYASASAWATEPPGTTPHQSSHRITALVRGVRGVRGVCSGIDGYDALSAAPGMSDVLSVLLIAVLARIGVYLVVIAWLPQLTRATWLGIGCWNLFVMLVFFDGIAGVSSAIAHPPRLMFAQQAPWGPSLGIAFCAAGILLGWVAVVVLACAEYGDRSQGDAAVLPARWLAKE